MAESRIPNDAELWIATTNGLRKIGEVAHQLFDGALDRLRHPSKAAVEVSRLAMFMAADFFSASFRENGTEYPAFRSSANAARLEIPGISEEILEEWYEE